MSRPAPAVAGTPHGPIGRDRELDHLSMTLRAKGSGSGHATFLLGEAGIGKSCLAREYFAMAARRSMPVLRGRGSSTGQLIPYRPLIEALSSYLRTSGPPDGRGLGPWLPALAQLIPELRTSALPGPPPNLAETSEALLRMLMALGHDTGCLLILEDLHDTDPESASVVEYLVDNLAETPVRLLATLRPEPGAALEMARSAGRRRSAHVFELRPLSHAEVRLMVARCLDTTPDLVPTTVVDRLARLSGGIPYYVEELVASTTELGSSLPAAIIADHDQRLGRLDPQTREVVLAAAVLGHRFSGSALRAVTGHDEPSLLKHLQSATGARLLSPDNGLPDRYAFRHELTTQALLATLLPAQRAGIAKRAAAALDRAELSNERAAAALDRAELSNERTAAPLDGAELSNERTAAAALNGAPDKTELSSERRLLIADLLGSAGQLPEAARHYAAAGRQALAADATATAAALLEKAYELAAETDRDSVAESLIPALAQAGQHDRALDMVRSAATTLDRARRSQLHTRLAWLALNAGRISDCQAQAAMAKTLLDEPPEPEQAASLAVIEAHLVHQGTVRPAHERVAEAERLARDAAGLAERMANPVVACQAWQLLAMLARERGFDAADECLTRMLSLAEANALPAWRAQALLRLGINESMRTGEITRLEHAWQVIQQMGSVTLGHTADATLAFTLVLRGDYTRAQQIVDRVIEPIARLGDVGNHLYLLMTSAMIPAHHGRRTEMEQVLDRFDRHGGRQSRLLSVHLGLCRAICALLEEDRASAESAFQTALAWDLDNPSGYYLTGRYGLGPLLDTMAGRAGWEEHTALTRTPGAALRWNRQFVLFSRAVLLGKAARGAEAMAAMAAALETAALFPLGRHLGLRLVAEAALRDGWGDPVAWLRTAEDYFHANGVAAVARQCRVLLRQAGASVTQHRGGHDQIPAELRRCRVTLREYEVFRCLAQRAGNKHIAEQLCISRRTVEKHMASLIAKTGWNRSVLSELAVRLNP